MLQLRDYQRASLDALYDYWSNDGGNGLIVLPTGAGKALVIAKLIEELLADYPSMRIANVTHSATLVSQNFKEFIALSPFAPAGLYSASLGRRDSNAQVLFCGIQSVANKTSEIGAIDLVIVDEAHAFSRDANTQYGKFFAGVREINADSRVVGLTATAYRMDSGSLTAGDDRLFDDVVYEIGIGDLMEQGYLTRLTSQKTTAKIDLKGVGTRGGEYIPGQLAEAAERIIEEAVAEDIAMSHDRKAALFFCSGQDNSDHVADAVRRHGRTCASLTSRTPKAEAAKIVEDFRAGRLWGLASANMITTGANFPHVDFISLIRSTRSAGLLVQMLGRGTRNSPGKTDCLVADHGKNLSYWGPIDTIKPKDPTSGEGEQPRKLCPQDGVDVEGKTGCGELLPISLMTCNCCGYIFPPNEEEKITAKADTTPVLSSEKPWLPVTGRHLAYHAPKNARVTEVVNGVEVDRGPSPPSVKATFTVDGRSVNRWYCPQHGEHPLDKSKKAKTISDRFWADHGGKRPFPSTVDAFLERAGELMATTEVQLDFSKSSKYPEIKAYRVGEANYETVSAPANDNFPTGNLARVLGAGRSAARDREAADERARLKRLADDYIPF
jgi:DNA repair protein RadD